MNKKLLLLTLGLSVASEGIQATYSNSNGEYLNDREALITLTRLEESIKCKYVPRILFHIKNGGNLAEYILVTNPSKTDLNWSRQASQNMPTLLHVLATHLTNDIIIETGLDGNTLRTFIQSIVDQSGGKGILDAVSTEEGVKGTAYYLASLNENYIVAQCLADKGASINVRHNGEDYNLARAAQNRYRR